MWPWVRHRRDVDTARAEADAAVADKQEAEKRHTAAEHQAEVSRQFTAILRREIDKNHWTELLLHAMGERNR